MQKVRGSNPLSATDLSDLCSYVKCQAKRLSALSVFVALVHGVTFENVWESVAPSGGS
jgi:hypothetical protein